MKVFGISGYSGAGKTTLIEKLLSECNRRSLNVATIKQSHHDVTLDQPGKDSWRHRQAGAQQVMLITPYRWMLTGKLRNRPEPTLNDYLMRLAECDLVLVEGYRHADLPKLEVHRAANGQPWLYPADPHILAVASDEKPAGLPCFSLEEASTITDFILEHARNVER